MLGELFGSKESLTIVFLLVEKSRIGLGVCWLVDRMEKLASSGVHIFGEVSRLNREDLLVEGQRLTGEDLVASNHLGLTKNLSSVPVGRETEDCRIA